MSAVFVIGLLYLCVVAVFLDAITLGELKAAGVNVNYAPLLSGNTVTARPS